MGQRGRNLFSSASRGIFMTIARGSIKSVKDGGKLRTLNLVGLQDESLSDVEHFESYGFTAVPAASGSDGAAEAIIGFVGGNRSHPIVIAFGDRRSRPKGRPAGDVTVYHYNGAEIHLAADGININTAGNPLTITAGGVTMTISPSGVAIEGGSVTHNGRDIGFDHVHTDVTPGVANTGAPA
ncbi:phage baseplate assembly protein V [Rhizobium sp. 11_C7_N12_5]|uniref:phage baseplate assembly protein V n=1 Tax=Rhizobium sp. 11_C7_N12_5 TaxID=3240770 RepID=UPI003F28ED24